MRTKARPLPGAEYGVVATLGQRLRVAVAHRAEQILAETAAASRRLRMFWPG